ncbi:MAG: cupin domain-containing protein [Pseudomonadota bacterium]|nr:cupin domain-containing protein [Pseudomonadota bacterium]
MSAGLQLLGGLSPAQFLRCYWQKQPLLISRAWPEFRDPLTPEDLAGLACEDGVEARLVQERGATPWELRYGPFAEEDFLSLPDSHWTLLVQDVDKLVPETAVILEPFRFIPDWRIDDLMISYAPEHGSVGPHVDDYDVFLLQGRGRRRWRIDARPVAADNFRTDTELRIMKRFEAQQEWVLGPGDMLYLPPRVAHYGVALEPCLTYSIGFRAPSHRELLSGFLDALLEDVDEESRYRDPELTVQANPGEISPAAVAQVTALLRDYLALRPAAVARWFGQFVTESKSALAAQPPEQPMGETQLLRHLRHGGRLLRNPGSRFAYLAPSAPGDAWRLFIDGRDFALGPDDAPLARLLCRERTLPAAALLPLLNPAARARLLALINEGWLLLHDDD